MLYLHSLYDPVCFQTSQAVHRPSVHEEDKRQEVSCVQENLFPSGQEHFKATSGELISCVRWLLIKECVGGNSCI